MGTMAVFTTVTMKIFKVSEASKFVRVWNRWNFVSTLERYCSETLMATIMKPENAVSAPMEPSSPDGFSPRAAARISSSITLARAASLSCSNTIWIPAPMPRPAPSTSHALTLRSYHAWPRMLTFSQLTSSGSGGTDIVSLRPLSLGAPHTTPQHPKR